MKLRGLIWVIIILFFVLLIFEFLFFFQGEFRTVGNVIVSGESVITYSDNGLVNSTQYNYSVRAFDASGKVSGDSNKVSVTTLDSTTPPEAALPAPTGLVVESVYDSCVYLKWPAHNSTPASNTSYFLYRDGVKVMEVPLWAYVSLVTDGDKGLAIGSSHIYTIAVKTLLNGIYIYSNQSAPLSATTLTTPPVPLYPETISINESEIDLYWSLPPCTYADDVYYIERRIAGSGSFTQVGVANSTNMFFADKTVAVNTNYEYRIRVNNGVADSYTSVFFGNTPSSANGLNPSAYINTTYGNSGMAPYVIYVNALASSYGSGNPLSTKYEWNFGDPSESYNVLEGWSAAHLYRNNGTYTITLKVTNNLGRVSTTSKSVSVSVDTRRKIYVAANGDDASTDPSNVSTPIQTFDRLSQMLSTKTDPLYIQNNSEILFRRGDSWQLTSSLLLTKDQNNLVIGAYGTGNKPVFNFTRTDVQYATILNFYSLKDIVLRDIMFDSAGFVSYYAASAFKMNAPTVNFAAFDLELSNVDGLTAQGGKSYGLLVQNVSNPSDNNASKNDTPYGFRRGMHGEYFVYYQSDDVNIIGNSIAMIPGDTGGVIRSINHNRVLIAHNNWTWGTSRDNPRAVSRNHAGRYLYESNNYFSGNSIRFGPLGGSDEISQMSNSKNSRTSWSVFENNKFKNPLYNSISGIHIYSGTEHLMIRGNKLSFVNATPISTDPYVDQYERGEYDINIINNTIINPDSRGYFAVILSPAQAIDTISSQYIIKDNKFISPNLRTGSLVSTYPANLVISGASDLNVLKTSSGNIWQLPAYTNPQTSDPGVCTVGLVNTPGYKTQAQWATYPQVSGDSFNAYMLTDYNNNLF